MLVALVDMGDIAFQCFNQLRLGKAQDFIIVAAAVKRLSAILQVLHAARTALRHELAEIRPRVFGVDIQNLFTVFIGGAPIAVLEEHKCAFEQGLLIRIAAVHGNGFPHGLFLRIGIGNHLSDAAHQIVYEADFAHILRLQVSEFLRQFIGIHVAIAGNQQLRAVGFDQLQKS